MSDEALTEAELSIVTGSLERLAAVSELSDMGISASPADAEHWLYMTARERRRAIETWAIWSSLPAPDFKQPRSYV